MEQHTFKNVNNCLNTNIYSYLEKSGGQNYNPYLNVDHFFNTRVNSTSGQLKTVDILYWYLIRAILLYSVISEAIFQ